MNQRQSVDGSFKQFSEITLFYGEPVSHL